MIMPYGVVLGQQTERAVSKYAVGAQYSHEFLLGGYVHVREWEFLGDKMKLRDLGVSNYPAMQIHVTRQFAGYRLLTLSYDHYFIRGSATFDRDITYNGTIIDGTRGIDVSPTRYLRLSLTYRARLWRSASFAGGYMAGVVFDHVKFYLDGEVSPRSTKNEVYEGFGRQALPYPAIGFYGRAHLGRRNYVNLDISGTYIPEFRSFFKEGGHVYLQYSLFQTDLNYSWNIFDFDVVIGAKLRYMHLFQNSAEDTNILRMSTTGPYIGLTYNFYNHSTNAHPR